MAILKQLFYQNCIHYTLYTSTSTFDLRKRCVFEISEYIIRFTSKKYFFLLLGGLLRPNELLCWCSQLGTHDAHHS